MDDLYQATDYRPWLRQALKRIRRDHPSRTARALSERLGIDPAHLSRVLAGAKHLAMRHIPELAEFLELDRSATRYLEVLVRSCTSPSPRESHEALVRMREMRGEFQRTLADDSYAYFSSWIHPAMRTLLSLLEFRGLGWTRLASLFRPEVTPDQARDSVDLLKRLGLVETDPSGILRPASGTVSTGEKWMGQAVHDFQKRTIALAGELLETVPRSERDVSTLTLPASRERMDELRDKIRHFRQDLMSWARDLPEEDCVVQLNIQLFPVADARLSDRPRREGAFR